MEVKKAGFSLFFLNFRGSALSSALLATVTPPDFGDVLRPF
jgi:hypothetical protein